MIPKMDVHLYQSSNFQASTNNEDYYPVTFTELSNKEQELFVQGTWTKNATLKITDSTFSGRPLQFLAITSDFTRARS